MRQRKVRVQFDGPLVFTLGVGPLPGIRHEIRQRVVPIGKTFVQFERLLRRRSRFGQILFRVDQPAVGETPIDVGQIGIGERVTGIGGDSLNEVFARFLPVLRPSLRAMEMSFEQQFVRFRVPHLARRRDLVLDQRPGRTCSFSATSREMSSDT